MGNNGSTARGVRLDHSQSNGANRRGMQQDLSGPDSSEYMPIFRNIRPPTESDGQRNSSANGYAGAWQRIASTIQQRQPKKMSGERRPKYGDGPASAKRAAGTICCRHGPFARPPKWKAQRIKMGPSTVARRRGSGNTRAGRPEKRRSAFPHGPGERGAAADRQKCRCPCQADYHAHPTGARLDGHDSRAKGTSKIAPQISEISCCNGGRASVFFHAVTRRTGQ